MVRLLATCQRSDSTRSRSAVPHHPATASAGVADRRPTIGRLVHFPQFVCVNEPAEVVTTRFNRRRPNGLRSGPIKSAAWLQSLVMAHAICPLDLHWPHRSSVHTQLRPIVVWRWRSVDVRQHGEDRLAGGQIACARLGQWSSRYAPAYTAWR